MIAYWLMWALVGLVYAGLGVGLARFLTWALAGPRMRRRRARRRWARDSGC